MSGAHRLEKVVNKDPRAILRLLSILQQPASLYCQITQRQLQLRNCRADLRMLSNVLWQRFQSLVSTVDVRFRL
jgi:hypothetical protein